MKSVFTEARNSVSRKSAANRRNAQRSTGPKTAAGKSAASKNATKHGLNTPVPDYMVRACQDQYRQVMDHVGPLDPTEKADLVYALAAHARLRAYRAELIQTIADESAAGTLRAHHAMLRALTQLGRLETYQRKSASRLAGLMKNA